MGKKLTLIATIYFVIGLIFAFAFASFYHWSALSYFSPGFYMVILTWPLQVPGFIPDFQLYGLSGKPL